MWTGKLKSTSVQHTELALSRGYPGNGVLHTLQEKCFCIRKHLFITHLSCLADSLWLQAALDTELSPLTSIYKKSNDTKYILISKVSLKIDGARGGRVTWHSLSSSHSPSKTKLCWIFSTALSAHKWGLLFPGLHLFDFDTYTVFQGPCIFMTTLSLPVPATLVVRMLCIPFQQLSSGWHLACSWFFLSLLTPVIINMAGATSPYTREAATGQILRSIESRSRIQTFAVWVYCDNWFRHRKKKAWQERSHL